MGFLNQVIGKLKSAGKNKPDFPNDAIRSYYESRTIKEPKYLCHAPFSNMYFNSVGDIANCWLTFDRPEKYSEDRTLKEIWFGETFTQLRENIKKFDLDKRCKTCRNYLESNNHVNVLAKAYDNDYPLGDFPTMMEFELTNTCNLECTMCTGLLSSAIRANREGLPKLKNPYGAKFVKELEEFIPHLHEARFNGGEPFLISIYYEIWERIIALNPKCKIVVATNGTVLTKKVKEMLERGNFHINISIDSLVPEKYAEIRVNGNLDKVLENFQYFKEYCAVNARTICVMINPMRNNWEELPEFVEFCNRNNVHLWFNSIMHPKELALWSLPAEELEKIYGALVKRSFVQPPGMTEGLFDYNMSTYKNLVNNQIHTWMLDARAPKKIPVWGNEPRTRESFMRYSAGYLDENNLDAGKLMAALSEIENEFEDEKELDYFYQVIHDLDPDIVVKELFENNAGVSYQKFREHYINSQDS